MKPDPDNLNPVGGSPDNSGKEIACRYCGAVKKSHVKWDDPLYCSGKCRKLDGADPLPVSELISEPKAAKATLADYKSHPSKYHRRLDPERLNWEEDLTPKQLKQAGLRANREPIPGDWDYIEEIPPVGKEEENV